MEQALQRGNFACCQNLSRFLGSFATLVFYYRLKALALVKFKAILRNRIPRRYLIPVQLLQIMTAIRSLQYQTHKLDLSKNRFQQSGHRLSDVWRIVAEKEIEFLDLSYIEGGLGEVVLPAAQLQSLRFLYLYNSGITSVRIEGGDLPNLEILHLGENRLTTFSLPRGFAKLRRLRLENNQLTHFELADFEGLKSLRALYLQGNKIGNDLQALFEEKQNCLNEFRTYYEDSKTTGSGHNNEVKVILIGNGSVGKTHIAKRLEDPDNYVHTEAHESTHAIELRRRELEVEDIFADDEDSEMDSRLMLNIWDFGGQDIYHATHRMFMQTNSLFLLVWDSENEKKPHHVYKEVKYKNEKLDYWLEYATCFGKESPILVVQNKIDDTRHFQAMENVRKRSLEEEYQNIRQFLEVSAKTGEGIYGLEDEILKIFNRDPKLLEAFKKRELPNGWLDVRSRIRAEQAKNEKGEETISLEIFREWCEQAKVGSSWETILTFLHNTGALFHRKPYFSGKIILNQAWAIEAVYKVFDKENRRVYETLKKEKGTLDYRLMRQIWRRGVYTDDERALFLDFMLSCELCFETTPKDENRYSIPFKERTFVVPQFLPQKMTEAYREEVIAKLSLTETHKIQYRFLPPVFIQRFIVQTKELAPVKGERYQQDIVLRYGNSFALVSADLAANLLTIRYQDSTVDWVQIIQEQMEVITREGRGRVKAKELLSKEVEECSFVERMMRGMDGKHPHLKWCQQGLIPTENQAIRVFVSAAMQDRLYLNELYSQLSVFVNYGVMEVWSEKDLKTGQHRKNTIQEKLDSADAVILLASSDLLEDTEKRENEVKSAVEYFRKGEKRLIPILVRAFLWKETTFGGLQVLPKDEQPIGNYQDKGRRDTVWVEVVREIQELLLSENT